MMAINTDRRNGTSRVSAARIPATTTTNAPRVIIVVTPIPGGVFIFIELL
jgi:hypothetical protein